MQASDFQYLGGKPRRYALKSDPTVTLSRRQFDQQFGRVKAAGFGTIEQQNKANKARRAAAKPAGPIITRMGKWTSAIFQNLDDMLSYRAAHVYERSIVWIVAEGTPILYQQLAGWYTVVAPMFNRDVTDHRIIDAAAKMFSKIEQWGLRWTAPLA